MMKMAQEIARKVQEEKDKADRRGDRGRPDRKSAGASASGGIWAGDEDVDAPPAYVAWRRMNDIMWRTNDYDLTVVLLLNSREGAERSEGLLWDETEK
jgi:hypothetical protein